MMAKSLTTEHIRNMQLDCGHLYGGERVEKRDRCMRVGTGIEDDSILFGLCRLNPINQRTFVV